MKEINKTICKSFRYKGWLCEWDESQALFLLYTPDELEQPRDFRTSEMEVSTKEQAKEFINSY